VLDRRFDQAVEQFERSATLAAGDDTASRWLAVHALAALAPLLASRGDTDRAAAMADAALSAAAEFNIDGVHLMAFARAAEAALLAGAYDRTKRMILEALHLRQRQADRRWVADTLEIAALLLAQAGRSEPASSILDTATSLRATSGEPLGGVRALADEVRRLSRKLDRSSAPPSTTTPPLSAVTPTEAIALAIAQLH
jgi:tetratricopeptide (TPR) repeat protein